MGTADMIRLGDAPSTVASSLSRLRFSPMPSGRPRRGASQEQSVAANARPYGIWVLPQPLLWFSCPVKDAFAASRQRPPIESREQRSWTTRRLGTGHLFKLTPQELQGFLATRIEDGPAPQDGGRHQASLESGAVGRGTFRPCDLKRCHTRQVAQEPSDRDRDLHHHAGEGADRRLQRAQAWSALHNGLGMRPPFRQGACAQMGGCRPGRPPALRAAQSSTTEGQGPCLGGTQEPEEPTDPGGSAVGCGTAQAGMATKMDEILAPTGEDRGPEEPAQPTTELGCQSGCQTGANLVSHILASWNQLGGWLRQVEGMRRVA